MIQNCQRQLLLEARLPAVLRGAEKPANPTEQLQFGFLCTRKKLYPAAAQFYREALTNPKLASVPVGVHYEAACAAALAGCGQGEGADKLDDKERAVWRQQALKWVRIDLTWWARALDKDSARTRAAVQGQMRLWHADPDLAGVREPDALAKLPEEERRAWRRLWSDVAALLGRDRD